MKVEIVSEKTLLIKPEDDKDRILLKLFFSSDKLRLSGKTYELDKIGLRSVTLEIESD